MPALWIDNVWAGSCRLESAGRRTWRGRSASGCRYVAGRADPPPTPGGVGVSPANAAYTTRTSTRPMEGTELPSSPTALAATPTGAGEISPAQADSACTGQAAAAHRSSTASVMRIAFNIWIIPSIPTSAARALDHAYGAAFEHLRLSESGGYLAQWLTLCFRDRPHSMRRSDIGAIRRRWARPISWQQRGPRDCR